MINRLSMINNKIIYSFKHNTALVYGQKNMSSPYKTFSCITYGCKVNFAVSSSISRDLTRLGYSQISKDDLETFLLSFT